MDRINPAAHLRAIEKVIMYQRGGMHHLDDSADTNGLIADLGTDQACTEKQQGRAQSLASKAGDMLEKLMNEGFLGLKLIEQKRVQPSHLGLDRPIDDIQIYGCLDSHRSDSILNLSGKTGSYLNRYCSVVKRWAPTAGRNFPRRPRGIPGRRGHSARRPRVRQNREIPRPPPWRAPQGTAG